MQQKYRLNFILQVIFQPYCISILKSHASYVLTRVRDFLWYLTTDKGLEYVWNSQCICSDQWAQFGEAASNYLTTRHDTHSLEGPMQSSWQKAPQPWHMIMALSRQEHFRATSSAALSAKA